VTTRRIYLCGFRTSGVEGGAMKKNDQSGEQRGPCDLASSTIDCYGEVYFQVLFQTVQVWVRKSLYHSVSSAEVEDIAQDCLWRFYKEFDFDKMASLPDATQQKRFLNSFLYLLKKRCVADFLETRTRKTLDDFAALIAIESDQIDRARAAIYGLPKADKRLLELRVVQDMEYSEIQDYYSTARKKGPSPGALRTRVYRIIDRLRAAVGGSRG
jgi:DNA-directed RNA polymerase specialized sigma24 family protein